MPRNSSHPRRGACQRCHDSKLKCTYTDTSQVKCDRCLKANRDCVPHVSMQGKIKNKKGKSKKSTKKVTTEPAAGKPEAPPNDIDAELKALMKGDSDEFDQTIDTTQNVCDGLSNSTAIQGNLNANQDINAQLESFLESFEKEVQLKSTPSPVNASNDITGSKFQSQNSQACLVTTGTAASIHGISATAAGKPPVLVAQQRLSQTAATALYQRNKLSYIGVQNIGASAHIHEESQQLPKTSLAGQQASFITPSPSEFMVDQMCRHVQNAQSELSTLSHTATQTQARSQSCGNLYALEDSTYASQVKDNNILVRTGNSNYRSPQILGSELDYLTEMRTDQELHTARVPSFAMPLKEWAKGALKCTSADATNTRYSGIASSAYLTAALRIAISLTKQVNTGDTALLHNSSNWVDHIRILLERNGNADDDESGELLDMPLPLGRDQSSIDYLRVDSAAILDCGRTAGCGISETQFEREAIFYLGIVFYTLFSGGEAPMPDLLRLAASDGAFISLSTLTLASKSTEVVDNCNRNKRRQGPTQSGRDVGPCESSCERLNFIGTPAPLSNLISDMLDCVHGDASGSDCYTKMTDVENDLQLMMNNPKLLRGAEIDNSSSLCLAINDIAIPRGKEIETLISCFRRCGSESCELAIITGPAGSGKSWLGEHVCRAITQEGGMCLIGKFDKMMQFTPFGSLSSAFEVYCDVLIDAKQSEWARNVIDNLRIALGSDVCYLIHLIPKLSQVLDLDMSAISEFVSNQNCSQNAPQKLQYLVCQLVEIVSMNSSMSITLLMDDVQYADEATIGVMNRLLRQNKMKFFFIGCARDMDSTHPFQKMADGIQASGINTTLVTLNDVNEGELNLVLSEMLCLMPRLVRPLAAMSFTKTRGNTLFFLELMLSLYRDGLLRFDLSRKRWIWNNESILSMKLPDNVALCYTQRISQLPIEVQLALNTISMFGCSVRTIVIEIIERCLRNKLVENLKIAAADGFITLKNGKYQFNHGLIQESCYEFIGDRDRRYNHLLYGKCLAQFASDDDILFTAINQVNLGGPEAVSNTEEYFMLAQYNLVAGKKAMSRLDYATAYSLFCHGISFLREDYFRVQYSLSLELHELACKNAFATKHFNDIPTIVGKVVDNARSFEDTLEVQYINMSTLAFTKKAPQALELGLTILSALGCDIPTLSNEEIHQYVLRVQSMLDVKRNDEILHCPLMTDAKNLMTMKFLARLKTISWIANSPIHTVIFVKKVELTLNHGLSSAAALTFACFGSYVAKSLDLTKGYRFSSLAQSLLEIINADEEAAEALQTITEAKMFTEPAQAANEFRLQVFRAAMKAGNTNYAGYSKLLYCSGSLWAGTHLALVNELISKAGIFFMQNELKHCTAVNSIWQRCVSVLLGRETGLMTMTELSERTSNCAHIKPVFDFYNLYTSFLMNIGDLHQYYKAFIESESAEMKSIFLNSNVIYYVYIGGLISFRIYRDTHEPIYLERGRDRMKDVKTWSQQGSEWNFLHRFELMRAEYYYCTGNITAARESYKHAIENARRHKFLNDEGLACELAAKFTFDVGDVDSSVEHYVRAHDKYLTWGATAKANQLFAYINAQFASASLGTDLIQRLITRLHSHQQ